MLRDWRDICAQGIFPCNKPQRKSPRTHSQRHLIPTIGNDCSRRRRGLRRFLWHPRWTHRPTTSPISSQVHLPDRIKWVSTPLTNLPYWQGRITPPPLWRMLYSVVRLLGLSVRKKDWNVVDLDPLGGICLPVLRIWDVICVLRIGLGRTWAG